MVEFLSMKLNVLNDIVVRIMFKNHQEVIYNYQDVLNKLLISF
jgi:hypothetical protein